MNGFVTLNAGRAYVILYYAKHERGRHFRVDFITSSDSYSTYIIEFLVILRKRGLNRKLRV